MEFRIWVETRLAGHIIERQLVAQVERPTIAPEEIGLSLEEGKTVLQQVQACMIQAQAEVLGAAHWRCDRCGRRQPIKDRRTRCVRTVFGVVRVTCHRFLGCRCRGGKKTTIWPLNERRLPGTTAELQYLYAKWGSTVPYRRAADLLGELLPICTGGVSHATLRRHTLAVGARLNQRITEPGEYDWPESRRKYIPPTKNLSIAIDGTYIRADRLMGLGEYHVVAGRIEREGLPAGCFAWVAQHWSCNEGDFLKAALETNGYTPQSQIRVLADGADGLTNLVSAVADQRTTKVLDWFHISMRLRPIEKMSPRIAIAAAGVNSTLDELLSNKLPRMRYQMWNGKWRAALERMREIWRATKALLNTLFGNDAERVSRFRQHLINLRDYLRNNSSGLRNYAKDRRNGLLISSAPAESLMSHLVNQRMGKRQPMRWSSEGAHLLLQVRCAVLDERLDSLFREWFPNFRRQLATPLQIAAHPQP
jgi:hypothetical protein